MGEWHPLGIFLGVFGFGTFLSIFIVAVTFGFHPSLTAVFLIWGAVFLWALWASVSNWLKRREGRYDLVLDFNSAALSLPALHGRKMRETILFSEIDQISARETTTQIRRGKQRTTTEVVLRTRKGEEFVVAKPASLQRAEQWTEWLRGRIPGLA